MELWGLRVGFDESGGEKADRKATGARAADGAIGETGPQGR